MDIKVTCRPLKENRITGDLANAPEFSGLKCLRFVRIEGGPVIVAQGDTLVCTLDGRDNNPVVLQENIQRTMYIQYIGIYEILQHGGTAAMFLERGKNGE